MQARAPHNIHRRSNCGNPTLLSLRPNQTEQPPRPCKDLDCTWSLSGFLIISMPSQRSSYDFAAASPSPLRRYSLHCRGHEGDDEGNKSREGAKTRSMRLKQGCSAPQQAVQKTWLGKSLVQAQGVPPGLVGLVGACPMPGIV
jgi:hypothetical protein